MNHRLLLPVGILVLAIAGCSWFRGEQVSEPQTPASNTAGGSSSAARSGAEPFVPTGDAKADLESLSSRFLTVQSVRAKMLGTGKTPVTSEVDFVAPDRFRVKADSGGQPVEMIIIGKETFMRLGTDWQKVPVDLGSNLPDFRASLNKEGMKEATNVRLDGEESIDGKPAFVYSYEGKGPNGVTFTSRVWIGKADGLPLKVAADYSSGDLRSMTITYDYLTPIKIEPPARSQ